MIYNLFICSREVRLGRGTTYWVAVALQWESDFKVYIFCLQQGLNLSHIV